VNLRHKKDPTPGPNGIHFPAYFPCEDIATEAFHNAAEDLCEGIPAALALNDSTITFLPKGEFTENEVETIRDTECTRPLGLKNTDNKVIISATIASFRKDMRRSTHASQRGFVPGRLLVQNVLDLDAAARIDTRHEGCYPASRPV